MANGGQIGVVLIYVAAQERAWLRGVFLQSDLLFDEYFSRHSDEGDFAIEGDDSQRKS